MSVLSSLFLIAGLVCLPVMAQTTTIQIPLTWSRSAEPAAPPVAGAAGLQSSVSAALGLLTPLTQPAQVWDNGLYVNSTANACKQAALDQGRSWASWNYATDGLTCNASNIAYDYRLFKATFNLNLPGLPVKVILYSPQTASQDIIPINDNFYFYVNGDKFVGSGGTDHGATHSGGTGDGVWDCPPGMAATMLAPETDGWYVPGRFDAPEPGAFVKGANTLEIVTEERCHWGGMGELALKIEVSRQCSYTQGGWGSTPRGQNPGTILDNNFLGAPINGSIVIGSGSCTHNFSSADSVEAFLPAGGTPGKLNCDVLAPAKLAAAGVLAGQVLALSINVKLSPAVIGGGPGGTPLGSLVLHNTGTWADGKTVAEVLAFANRVLGGEEAPALNGFSYSSLNYLVTQLNEGFDNCKATSWTLAHLAVPTQP